jgi:phenylalanyl-tRNA synthetase beta chain
VRDRLVSLGLQEVITYALTTEEREKTLGLPVVGYVYLENVQYEHIRLQNPISNERVVMRHHLLGGVLEVAAMNLQHTNDVRLFEIGSVYIPRPDKKLPDEPRHLAIVLCGVRQPEFWGDAPNTVTQTLDFFDLKGILEALMADLHVASLEYRSVQMTGLHPRRAAQLVVGEQTIADFGELHPKVAEAFNLQGRQVLVARIYLETLRGVLPARHLYQPVPRFPAALRDLAVIVAESLPAERVAGEIRAAGGALLREVRLFDLYRGESIPAGHKSLAYALTYQAEDRTLTDNEVKKAHEKIMGRLKHVLKAQIRDK